MTFVTFITFIICAFSMQPVLFVCYNGKNVKHRNPAQVPEGKSGFAAIVFSESRQAGTESGKVEEMGRKPTIQMIAELAGVSRGTVDRVLNNRSYVKAEVRERVLRIANEQGYVTPREAHLREQQDARKPLSLGVLLPSWGFGHQFLEEVQTGIDEARLELEDADVKIIQVQCDTELPAEAVRLLQSLREQGVQGIAVCALQDQLIEQELRRMKEEGIPVVTFNTDLPGSGRDLFVGEDIRQSGRLAAQMMSKCVRPGEQILVALGNKKFDGHRLRMEGFEERMRELGFPEEDLFSAETFNDYGTTLHEVSEAIRLHPQLRGIYMANLSVTACAEVVRAYNKKGEIHVICHDINAGIRQLMRDGYIDFTIPQDFVRQGREPLIWLTNHLRNKNLPDSGRFDTLQILCAENV